MPARPHQIASDHQLGLFGNVTPGQVKGGVRENSPIRLGLAGCGLGQPGPANTRLNVSYPRALEVDLNLLLLDVPVADG